MTKKDIIESILSDAKIHHNISTLRMSFPDIPEKMDEETATNIFWNSCQYLIESFIAEWEGEAINDSGNRNICGCNATKEGEKRKPDNSNIRKPENILPNGICKKHDLWDIYQCGRMGATLYWDKYWNENNLSGVYFKYNKDELYDIKNGELLTILSQIRYFNKKVKQMLESLPEEIQYQYNEWQKQYDKDKKAEKQYQKEKALGLHKTLKKLLSDNNPQIVRLAKGIKKELTK